MTDEKWQSLMPQGSAPSRKLYNSAENYSIQKGLTCPQLALHLHIPLFIAISFSDHSNNIFINHRALYNTKNAEYKLTQSK